VEGQEDTRREIDYDYFREGSSSNNAKNLNFAESAQMKEGMMLGMNSVLKDGLKPRPWMVHGRHVPWTQSAIGEATLLP
jgi:hypothetical protein